MGVNINKFKEYVDFVSNKVQDGAPSPREFNEAANRAQMQVFEKDRAIFIQEELSSDFIKEFLKRKIFSGPFVGGEFTVPADFEHISDIRSYRVDSGGKGRPTKVNSVKSADWGEILSSALNEPTETFPKYNHFGKVIRIAPITLTSVAFEYFRTPIAPVWAFTTVNGRSVYDASNSTDFEWGEYAMNNVAAYYLQLIGVNLKDNELSNFAQVYKQETNSLI